MIGGMVQGAMGATQASMGVSQTLLGAMKGRKAAGLRSAIPQNDYTQNQMLLALRQKQRGMEAGTDTMSMANKELLREGVTSGQTQLRKGSGGSTASLIAGTSALNRGYGRNVTQLMSNQANRAEITGQRIQGLVGQMAQRRLSLQMQRYLQKLAESKNLMTQGQSNINSGVVTMGESGKTFAGQNGGGGSSGGSGGLGGNSGGSGGLKQQTGKLSGSTGGIWGGSSGGAGAAAGAVAGG